VAILDTGVEADHPFLAGKVVAEACYSTSDASQGAISLCPGGGAEETGPSSGQACTHFDAGCYHGTHVAGIAAGIQDESFAGVARSADIVAIQVFTAFDCGDGSICALGAYDSDIIKALEHVYELSDEYNIAAANMSLGGNLSSGHCPDSGAGAYVEVGELLRSAGVAVVVASGNDGVSDGISYPACTPGFVSVGSTTKSDGISDFSNSAPILELLAPGSDIYASITGGEYTYLSGTSMATPHVTGTWAVLKSRNPDASVDEVLDAVRDTGEQIVDPRNGLSKPRVRVSTALGAISVSFRKHASPEVVDPAGVITYTLTATNNLDATVEDVFLSDALPAHTSYVNDSASDGGSASGGVVEWPPVDIAPGETVTRTFQVAVEAGYVSTIDFTDDVEGGDSNWYFDATVGAFNWSVGSGSPHAGTQAFFASDPEIDSDQHLVLDQPVRRTRRAVG
jgi:uncharacterized repeat protein (TIGR01451 family)